jgi:hypothetical protein
MKKTLMAVGFFLLAALPAAAQSSEIGLLVGGAKAMKTAAAGRSKFQHGFEEISWGTALESGTIFKVKVGRMNATTAFVTHNSATHENDLDGVDRDGQLEYADAVVEYRFAEAWGYTGLFAGTGLYRQRGVIPVTSGATTTQINREESDYGFVGGVNGLFPITRSIGITAEAAYHWVHFYRPAPRYATVGVGLRFGF